MRKNRLKFGVLFLLGLIGYFLALSALLVASAALPEGGNTKPSKTPHFGKDTSKKIAGTVVSDGTSASNASGRQIAEVSWSEINHCFSVTRCYLQDDTGETTGQSWQNAGNTFDSKAGFGGRDFSYPATYGSLSSGGSFPTGGSPFFYGPGAAFGPHADFGSIDQPSASDGDGDTPEKDKSLPAFWDPGPEISFIEPDPSSSDSTVPEDKETPPGESAAALPVPEPSTFWVFVASLVALVMTPSSIGRLLRARLGRKMGSA